MDLLYYPLALGILAYSFKRYMDFRRLIRPKSTRRQYERKVANHLKFRGFKSVRVSRRTKDGGYDVSAKRKNKKRVAECKMYRAKRKVSVKEVREIYGVAQSMKAEALFYTTSGYTQSAKDFAKMNGVRCYVLR